MPIKFPHLAATPSTTIYGTLYFLCIPVFAFLYFLQPAGSFDTNLKMDNYLTCLYFSTITITTVGFGDVSPVSILAQVSVIIESIAGLFIIGLFLNALAQRQSATISEHEKRKAEQQHLDSLKARLLRHFQIVSLTIKNYELYIFALTTPIIRRTSTPPLVNLDF